MCVCVCVCLIFKHIQIDIDIFTYIHPHPHIHTPTHTYTQKLSQEFERIIVFDHDLEFSPSVLRYASISRSLLPIYQVSFDTFVLSFYQTCAAVFDKDPSLFAASAWNELGLPQVPPPLFFS